MILYFFYSIIFISLQLNKANEEITFNPFVVNDFYTRGKATFLGPLFINANTNIEDNTFLNDSIFFNHADNQNKIILNSKDISINGLEQHSIGKNFLILIDNQLYIMKNDSTRELLQDNYQAVYVSNIISTNNQLQIANTSKNDFQIGNKNKIATINLYGDAIIFLGSINTQDNLPLNITNEFKSIYSLDITNDLNIENNILTENIKINDTIEINTPINFFDVTVNGTTKINTPNITILTTNGILDFNKQTIKILGLPEISSSTLTELTLLVLDKNNNLYKHDFQEASNINAIGENILLSGDEFIKVSDENHSISIQANTLIFNTVTIKKSTDEIIFNEPIFQVSNNNEISQLIFNENIIINDLTQVNNLLTILNNNNTISNLNKSNKANNTIFNSNQIIFLNINQMESYLGSKLVIDANNIIGIEGTHSKYNTPRALYNKNFSNIQEIVLKLQDLKKIANYFTLLHSKHNYLKEKIASHLNELLQKNTCIKI